MGPRDVQSGDAVVPAPADPLSRDPASVPAYAIGRAGRVMSGYFADRLAEVGLRPHSFLTLLHLSREPSLTSAELARRLEMTPQSMSSLLRTLAGRGWVERPGTARRGQRVHVRLTDAGRAALAGAGPAMGHLGDPDTIGLSAAEAALLHRLLERVLAALGDRPAPSGTTAR